MISIVFWVCFGLLTYHLIIYGLLLFLINTLSGKKRKYPIVDEMQLPNIDIVCAAFNEEKHIEQKIQSFLSLDYPKSKIKLLIISDDSTDRTNEIVKKYLSENIKLIIQKPRAGKQAAQNLIIPELTSEFVLSTDANSIFEQNSVRLLANAILSNPKIGLVSGKLKLLKSESGDSGESLYWHYESFLKQMDSDFYSIIGANGSIFLIKKELFKTVDNASVDDFERTMTTLGESYLAVYEPHAIVYEQSTEKATEEISRKIRIITQEWNALMRNSQLLNPFKFPAVSFILFSHKLIRWLFFIFAIGIFVTSILLSHMLIYFILFILQFLVYLIGSVELYLQKRKRHIPGGGLAAYLTGMLYASLAAFIHFSLRKKFGTWNPIR
jgi:poly-beta-1,6-N-acetyl-D-glucosamine synthase